MLEQTNEVMEVLGRPYGVPEDVDEDDLEAGGPVLVSVYVYVDVWLAFACTCTCTWHCKNSLTEAQ